METPSLWQLSLAALVVYIITAWIRSIHREQKFQQFAKSKGAVSPFHAHTKLPWGVDGMLRMLTAASADGKEDVLDDILIQRLRTIGRNTYKFTTVGGVETITTCDPKNFQAMLGTQFHDFSIGERRKKQFGVLLGNSIFSSDGEDWSKARALFRPLFARANINDLDETEKAVQTFFTVISKGKDGWTDKFDIQPLFYRFTMDMATAFIFGQSVETQASAAFSDTTKQDREAVEFAEAFTLGQQWLFRRIIMQGLYWLADGKKYRKAVRDVHRFANRIIEVALRQKAYSPDKKQGKYSVVQELANTTQDATVIRDQVIALMAAGRDTTSALLSWMFYILSTEPRVFSKLRAEIINHFGSSLGEKQKITFESLKACRYLQHFILEVLRMYPTVPLNGRTAVRNTTLPSGGGPDESQPIPIRKGQMVGMVIYAMHRREDLWGEDANVFRPERFEDRKLDWSFIPFSGGPRICLGQQYAMTEAAYLTVRFLQTFDGISWEGSPKGPGKGIGLTLFPRDGTHIKLRYASGKA